MNQLSETYFWILKYLPQEALNAGIEDMGLQTLVILYFKIFLNLFQNQVVFIRYECPVTWLALFSEI